MRQESEQMNFLIAELTLKNRVLTPALAGGAGKKVRGAWEARRGAIDPIQQ